MQNTSSNPIDCPPHLVYVSDEEPGLARVRKGDRVIYLEEEGEELLDQEIIERIETLVIPPNWENTWICKLENGHFHYCD